MAAHPLSLDVIEWASDVANGRSAFCNVCKWRGSAFEANDDAADRCPGCGSTPLGRLVYRYLATSGLGFRKLACVAMLDDDAVQAELGRMFVLAAAPPKGGSLGSPDVVIADFAKAPSKRARKGIADAIGGGSVAIMGSSPAANSRSWSADVAEDDLRRAGFKTERVTYRSRAVSFAPDGLLVARTE